MNAQAHQVYKKTQVSTASQGDLIVMLFDAAIRFAKQAKERIDEQDFEQAHHKIVRVQDIMAELTSALRMDAGEIAQNLHQLYSFVSDQLLQANVTKDPVHLDQALQILRELRDTWAQVVEKPYAGNH